MLTYLQHGFPHSTLMGVGSFPKQYDWMTKALSILCQTWLCIWFSSEKSTSPFLKTKKIVILISKLKHADIKIYKVYTGREVLKKLALYLKGRSTEDNTLVTGNNNLWSKEGMTVEMSVL